MDIDKIARILAKNKDKEFVKRVIEPEKYPKLDNQDGSVSTHSMAWSGADGKYYVYPTVFLEEDGSMKRYEGRSAFMRALGKNDVIEFDNPKDADEFGREYKKIWKENFDPEGDGYDYKSALKCGISPEGKDGHWSSRNSRTGQLLKGKKHKTWNLLENAEEEAGYEIFNGEDGKYYSEKKRK